MARGKSGRIVLEVDPLFKKKLYLELAKNDLTLKDWFIQSAEEYINRFEDKLHVAEKTPEYKGSK